ncbi:MAG: hypothetical protein K2W95_26575 [Candidatus Obscuribacterales bacterium]|nr:hypothetical protein [Candidatus Obscuribacterales bacterium]
MSAWLRTSHSKAFVSVSLLAMLLSGTGAKAETSGNGIVIPSFDDKYSAYVRNLESGKTDIDYSDFRNSFLESRQFDLKRAKLSEYTNLKKEVYAQMKQSNYQAIIKAAKAMLNIDYTTDQGDQTFYFGVTRIFARLEESLRKGSRSTK